MWYSPQSFKFSTPFDCGLWMSWIYVFCLFFSFYIAKSVVQGMNLWCVKISKSEHGIRPFRQIELFFWLKEKWLWIHAHIHLILLYAHTYTQNTHLSIRDEGKEENSSKSILNFPNFPIPISLSLSRMFIFLFHSISCGKFKDSFLFRAPTSLLHLQIKWYGSRHYRPDLI